MLLRRLWDLITTPYAPDDSFADFMERAVTQDDPRARATVAVLTPA